MNTIALILGIVNTVFLVYVWLVVRSDRDWEQLCQDVISSTKKVLRVNEEILQLNHHINQDYCDMLRDMNNTYYNLTKENENE